jgi:hypothetical protein
MIKRCKDSPEIIIVKKKYNKPDLYKKRFSINRILEKNRVYLKNQY